MAFENKQFQQGSQVIQRQTAHKIWLSNLNNGTFVQGFKSSEGFSPSYVEIKDLKISRVNVIATIVDLFKSEDGNYFSFTLDDGTATIRMKAFNEDTNALLNIEKGNQVLIVGRVREYQGELYIAPEITKKIIDPNITLIRKAELLKNLGKPEEFKFQANALMIQAKLPQQPRDPSHEELRQKIIDMLVQKEDTGAEISTLSTLIQKDDQTTETVIKELLLEGEIYENKPGFYKAI